jgi:hypothetical protein
MANPEASYRRHFFDYHARATEEVFKVNVCMRSRHELVQDIAKDDIQNEHGTGPVCTCKPRRIGSNRSAVVVVARGTCRSVLRGLSTSMYSLSDVDDASDPP